MKTKFLVNISIGCFSQLGRPLIGAAGLILFGASVANAEPYSSVVLANNPRGYFRFDEPQGSLVAANDPSAAGGSGMNGVYANSPTLNEPGIIGAAPNTAVALNASASQRIQDVNDAYSYTAYSLEAWVRPSVSGGQGIIVNTAGDPTSSWSNNVRLVSSGGADHFSFYLYDALSNAAKGFVADSVVVPGRAIAPYLKC